MSTPGLRLRHLVFLGDKKKPAAVSFGAGLNVIYGASETGKSFIVEALDFMLGGGQGLRDIGERIGYDRILLGLESIGGEQFTIQRSTEGGNFLLYPGLHEAVPGADVQATELADQHSEKSSGNLSTFLLTHCGLAGKRVRKNSRGETNSLSFRYLARLVIVDENEIMAQRSPLSDGNPTADTPNFATFKVLLTGVDDSALVSRMANTPEDQSREAQMELLDKLVDDYRDRLKELTKDPKDLGGQLERIDASLNEHAFLLSTTESDYRELSSQRRDLRKRAEEGRDRRAEIGGLLERFTLLKDHYVSDMARLRGIEEGGTLFEILGKGPCPLCGAEPEHQQRGGTQCDGDVAAVVGAARSELAKIEILHNELAETIDGLSREAAGFDRRLPQLEQQLDEVSRQIDRMVSPKLTTLRATYAEFADKRGAVREAITLQQTIEDIERRRLELEKLDDDKKPSTVSDGDLPVTVADEFAQKVEAILKEWHFPEAERVHFDPKKRDLIIAGKLRSARGKGLRAITHAAFTIGLLEYCRSKGNPHPGFVILDSPLLAYREPKGDDDRSDEEKVLAGTDLSEQFYSNLAASQNDRQIIVIENRDPSTAVRDLPQSIFFSKNPARGRYGFFPLEDAVPADDVNGTSADNGTPESAAPAG